ncbi:MAG: hypothetical protein PHP45_08335 [Elusimicrobiales bacterium]|nr:hypothetical protein [Elusimicrobiales bacterium]
MKDRKQLLIFTLLIFCQTLAIPAQSQPQFKPDPKLLLPLGKFWEENGRPPVQSPFLVKFSTGGKSLWFVAAHHSNSVETDTFRLIKKAFTEFKPQALIVEGVERERGTSAESYKSLVKDADLDKTKFWLNGERGYAVAFAVKQKIACVGGEPPEKYLNEELRKKYSMKDVFGFYVVRYIPQLKRQNPDKKIDFDKWYEKNAQRDWPITDAPVSLSEFKAWYGEKNKEKFDFDKIDNEISAPISGGKALFTQQVSYEVGIVRDIAILENIADMLNQYDRVLIVYGSGHFEQQAKALENMLGKGDIVEDWKK